MAFRDKQEWEKRWWIPESVWPLFRYSSHSDTDYEAGISANKSIQKPAISVYTLSDEDTDQKAFSYSDVIRLIQDGVIDNIVPNTSGIIGISQNDERVLADFIRKAGDAWYECVDRLDVNRLAETGTTKYKIEGEES